MNMDTCILKIIRKKHSATSKKLICIVKLGLSQEYKLTSENELILIIPMNKTKNKNHMIISREVIDKFHTD